MILRQTVLNSLDQVLASMSSPTSGHIRKELLTDASCLRRWCFGHQDGSLNRHSRGSMSHESFNNINVAVCRLFQPLFASSSLRRRHANLASPGLTTIGPRPKPPPNNPSTKSTRSSTSSALQSTSSQTRLAPKPSGPPHSTKNRTRLRAS